MGATATDGFLLLLLSEATLLLIARGWFVLPPPLFLTDALVVRSETVLRIARYALLHAMFSSALVSLSLVEFGFT